MDWEFLFPTEREREGVYGVVWYGRQGSIILPASHENKNDKKVSSMSESDS